MVRTFDTKGNYTDDPDIFDSFENTELGKRARKINEKIARQKTPAYGHKTAAFAGAMTGAINSLLNVAGGSEGSMSGDFFSGALPGAAANAMLGDKKIKRILSGGAIGGISGIALGELVRKLAAIDKKNGFN